MKRPLVLAFSLLALAALSGCTASPATEAGASQPVGGTTATEESDRLPLSPVNQFMSEVHGWDDSPEERTRRDLALSTEEEDRIAECMKAEGFEYTPTPWSPDYDVDNVDESGNPVDDDGVSEAHRNDREWVASYGYGVVENPGRSMDKPYGYQFEKEQAESDVEARANPSPNAVYRESLSPAQREAYNLAFSGPPYTEEDAASGIEPDSSGCQWEAYVAVRGERPEDMPEHKPLFEAIADLSATFPWPGIPELDASWSACMAENERPGFTSQRDADASIRDEHTALWAAANRAPAERSGDMAIGELTEQTPPAMEALTALAEKERELALIDLGCREEVDYWDTYRAIQFAEEERFMDDHRREFDALRAAYEQQGGSR